MRRFCWRERSEKLNWRMLSALDVSDVVRRGDPIVLEPYALHVTFARLPASSRDPQTRDAWFLVRVLQLSMEYLLFMRARDGDVLESLSQELRQVETERDGLLLRSHKWKARVRSGDKQVEKLHQVLQNIAKLLQVHGASPSAVATIETLLTELVSERRTKQKRRVLQEEEEEEDEMDVQPRRAEQEARVCGFCGKLFSSAKFLEKHLVRRHSGEGIGVEAAVKRATRRNAGEDKEDVQKSDESPTSEATMQRMVQQVQRALQEHEEKLRLLADEEAQKIKHMYDQICTEAKRAGESEITQVKEELLQGVQRQLDEVYLQKEKVEEELADMKRQIHLNTSNKEMIEATVSTGLPPTLLYKSDDALRAAEIETKNLRQTLEAVNAELTASRKELAKVQALHLSALKKKKQLAETLALSQKVSAVVQQNQSCQTEPLDGLNKDTQTDEQSGFQQSTSKIVDKSVAHLCKSVGTDPVALHYQDVGIQTVDDLDPLLIKEIEPTEITHDLDLMQTRALSSMEPEPVSQTSVITDAGQVAEDNAHFESIVSNDAEHVPDYIHRIYSQDLLDVIAERAQSAASQAPNDSLVSKNYSPIFRRKYVRSRFQHDEDLVTKRVSSCLMQLEQFACRFGVPARSARLSENNVQIVQQALHGHLEVLPAEVLTKMTDCENAVNALIEKEWAPMEKTRLQALERFKAETRAKSEHSRELVRQAMAAFRPAAKTELPNDSVTSENVETASVERSINKDELQVSTDEKLHDDNVQHSSADQVMCSGVRQARRYSANNQLTVIVGEEPRPGSTIYVTDDFKSNFSTDDDDLVLASPIYNAKVSLSKVREGVGHAAESRHGNDELSIGESNLSQPPSIANEESGAQSSHDDLAVASSPLSNSSAIAARSSSLLPESLEAVTSADTALPEVPDIVPEVRLSRQAPTIQTRSIRVNAAADFTRTSSSKANLVAKSPSRELCIPESTAMDASAEAIALENVKDNEWETEDSKYPLFRVDPSPNSRMHGTLVSAHSTLSTQYEMAIADRQQDQLSTASECSMIRPMTTLGHTLSIAASSEVSFDTSILSLESESLGASANVIEVGVAEDRRSSAEETASTVPTATHDIQNDSVIPFDDSDIEEVILT